MLNTAPTLQFVEVREEKTDSGSVYHLASEAPSSIIQGGTPSLLFFALFPFLFLISYLIFSAPSSP